jgi:O-antigen ligase
MASGLVMAVAITVTFSAPLVAIALAVSFPVAALAYHRPAALLLLFLTALPLLGDEQLIGPIRPSILATTLVVIFGAMLFIRHQQRFLQALRRLRHLVAALASLAALGTASTIANLNEDFLWNFVEAGLKPLSFAVLMLIVVAEFDSRRRARLLCWALVAGGFLSALYALYTYVAGTAPMPDGTTPRLAGTFTEYNALGSYMLLTSMFTLGVAQLQRSPRARLVLHAMVGIQVGTLLLTLTLGSILGFVTAMLVFLLLRGGRRNGLLKFALVAAVVGVITVLYFPAVTDKIALFQDRVIRRFRGFEVGFAIIRDNLLFGVGSKGVLPYLWAHPDIMETTFGYTQSVPHNVFIDTFVRKGVFAFLSLAAVLLALAARFRHYFRIASQLGLRSFAAALAGGMVGFLQQDLSNNMLLHPRIGVFFFLALPVLICLVRVTPTRAFDTLAPNAGVGPPQRAGADTSVGHALPDPRATP